MTALHRAPRKGDGTASGPTWPHRRRGRPDLPGRQGAHRRPARRRRRRGIEAVLARRASDAGRCRVLHGTTSSQRHHRAKGRPDRARRLRVSRRNQIAREHRHTTCTSTAAAADRAAPPPFGSTARAGRRHRGAAGRRRRGGAWRTSCGRPGSRRFYVCRSLRSEPAHERLVGTILREALLERRSRCRASWSRDPSMSALDDAGQRVMSMSGPALPGVAGDRPRAGTVGPLHHAVNGGLLRGGTCCRYSRPADRSPALPPALAAAHYGMRSSAKDSPRSRHGRHHAACVIAEGGRSCPGSDRPPVSFKKGSGLRSGPVIEISRSAPAAHRPVDARSAGSHRTGERAAPDRWPTHRDRCRVWCYYLTLFFLGGQMRLDPDAPATRSPSGSDGRFISVREAAWASTSFANRAWRARASAIERAATSSGSHLRFGALGRAPSRGRTLRARSVIPPAGAGVMSAVGSVAPVRLRRTLGALDARLGRRRAGGEMEAGPRRPRPDDSADQVGSPAADMRYRKQGYEIRVPVPPAADAARRDRSTAASRPRNLRDLRPHRPGRADQWSPGGWSPRAPGRRSGSRPALVRGRTCGPRRGMRRALPRCGDTGVPSTIATPGAGAAGGGDHRARVTVVSARPPGSGRRRLRTRSWRSRRSPKTPRRAASMEQITRSCGAG